MVRMNKAMIEALKEIGYTEKQILSVKVSGTITVTTPEQLIEEFKKLVDDFSTGKEIDVERFKLRANNLIDGYLFWKKRADKLIPVINGRNKGGATIKVRAQLKYDRVGELIEAGKISLPIKKANLVPTFSRFGLTTDGGFTEDVLYNILRERKKKLKG